MKIYFAGSIRGGRDDADLYNKIIKHLQQYGEVLTEHVGSKSISDYGETQNNDQQIYRRDLEWLNSADTVVAEVTNPSLGVGFELAKATVHNKKILCLYKIQNNKRLSAMIAGCPDVKVQKYSTLKDAKKTIDNFFKLNLP